MEFGSKVRGGRAMTTGPNQSNAKLRTHADAPACVFGQMVRMHIRKHFGEFEKDILLNQLEPEL